MIDSELIKDELKHKDDNNIININQSKITQLPIQKPKFYQYVGRTMFLFLDKYSNPIFIIGPNWPLFICLITSISSIMLMFYLKFWDTFGFKTKIFRSSIFWIFIISYTYTSLINPGYPRNTLGRTFGIPKNDYYFCEYCGFYFRECSYGSHCDICQIFIEKHDHHCVWTGHCIGKNNKNTFIIFTLSLFVLLLYYTYALYLVVSSNTK